METIVNQYTDCGPIEFEAGLLPCSFSDEISKAANCHSKPACFLDLFAGAGRLSFLLYMNYHVVASNQVTKSMDPLMISSTMKFLKQC